MPANPLPTGKEPPKGYEKLYESLQQDDTVMHIDRVAASQMSALEIRELEALRKEAIERIREATGYKSFYMSFDNEMNLWPKGKSPSDKLIFRAYKDGELVGYTLVVRGWPDVSEWTVQHLIVSPSNRLQGVGMSLIAEVENVALSTTEEVTHISAVPVSPDNDSFWEFLGYESQNETKVVQLDDHEFTYNRFRKAIR